MISSQLHRLTRAIYDDRDLRFWFCQIIGWAGWSLATFLSITLIDDNVSWPHVGHIALSAVLGIFVSWPMRTLYNRTFGFSIPRKVLVAALAVFLLSAAWNALRILIFAWMVGEEAIWDEYHYWYYGALSIFLGWTVLYYGIKYYDLLALEHQKLLQESNLKKEEEYKRLSAESSARDAQLKMLRYQLNPHFLFNTLNAINALVKLNENDKAGEMIELLGDFLRHSLEQDALDDVSLDDELKSLELYLAIEKTRFEDRLILEFDIEARARSAQVPSLILQPIIENAMKYAVEPSEVGCVVQVSARVVDESLDLRISDTGPGLTSQEFGQGRGIGLRNTLDRLKTHYEDKYTFEALDNQPTGLSVHIRFPFWTEPSAGALS